VQKNLLSIVVPCFNEEAVIRETYKRLVSVELLGMEREIIFVDDGSWDATHAILGELAAADERVKVIRFVRNFGHQPATSAGIAAARGAAVVIIDADLQDPPEIIPQMISRWREGYEIVYGKRISRKGETVFKKVTAWAYYRILRRLGGKYIPRDTGDFRLIDAKVAAYLNSLSEHNRFLRGLTAWAGFTQCPVEYVRNERYAGETKYTLRKMVRLAGDGITSFSAIPLKLPMGVGITVSILAFVYLVAAIVLAATGILSELHAILAGVFLLLGIIMIFLGVMGMYIDRIYDEAKARPYYIIKDTINTEDKDA